MNKITPNQLLYYAMDLTNKRSVSDTNRFTGVLSEARVDLNPHQIEAALFAFHSPLSKCAILADEVGLGKTIEAGIILSQCWAEQKRHILIIVPASLRNQWNIELMEKFYIPSRILEKNTYDDIRAKGKNPFDDRDNIIICSYQFFVQHAKEIAEVIWDLAVIDEAHKLRNVFKKDNVIGNAVKKVLAPTKKILLTATPLQNSLKELYGLVSIVDDNYFASAKTFAERYNAVSTRSSARYGELRSRLIRIVHRTLRSQVTEYVNYTKRTAIIQSYTPNEKEQELYIKLSLYLQREFNFGIPERQRALLSLILRKIMASSSYALSFTLSKMISRLSDVKRSGDLSKLGLELLNDLDSESEDFEDEGDFKPHELNIPELDEEIKELESYRALALSVGDETKAKELLNALALGFEKMNKLGGNRKALIFTESRRTQEYLKKFLEENEYEDSVVCFNGTNNDADATIIYHEWLLNNANSAKVSGNPVIDRKQALVDYFKDKAQIMIATEAGAEGINLQFCSLVVNYDMPWNPQRIEQRIGRCHRYGQKFDVVVINFVNKLNKAENRIYELLNSKFNLFEGVFGSSDEVLGSLESGVDFEKRLNRIFQTCRTEEEIQNAFDELQHELEDTISERIKQTKKSLIENFDEEVVEKLKIRQQGDSSIISLYKRHLWNIILSVLGDQLYSIDENNLSFEIKNEIEEGIVPGMYTLKNEEESGFAQVRLSSLLGEYVVNKALNTDVPDSDITFDMTHYPYNISILSDHIGERGIAKAYKVSALNQCDTEEHIFICCETENGEALPLEFGEKLMELSNVGYKLSQMDSHDNERADKCFESELEHFSENLKERNNSFIIDELDKLDMWVDEMMTPYDDEINSLDKKVRELKSAVRHERNAAEKLRLSKERTETEKLLNKKRREYFDLRDEYEEKANSQNKQLEKMLESNVSQEELFRFKWSIV